MNDYIEDKLAKFNIALNDMPNWIVETTSVAAFAAIVVLGSSAIFLVMLGIVFIIAYSPVIIIGSISWLILGIIIYNLFKHWPKDT
jgi:hypothetical protein